MKYTIGASKTLSGLNVTIFTTTARGPYPIVGVVHNSCEDDAATWTSSGRFKNFGKSTSTDLVGSVDDELVRRDAQ